jgi:hypothetical protein
MTSENTPMREIESFYSSNYVATLNLSLITELRKLRYKVNPVSTKIWDKKNGYNYSIKNTKILDQWIDYLDVKEVLLYNIVLPQRVILKNHKIGFFLESLCISHDILGKSYYTMSNKDIRCDVIGNEDSTETLELNEGLFLACY